MIANELMVGDWVYMKAHRGFDSQYIRVETIPDSSSDTHHGHIGAYPISEDMDFRDIEDSHLEPIPLTPEILEKNGFDINGIPEDMQPVEERDWSDDTYVWSRQETPDEVMEVSVYMDDPYNFFAEIICQYCHVDGVHIKYVHELQHALRLCGIDKTIEL